MSNPVFVTGNDGGTSAPRPWALVLEGDFAWAAVRIAGLPIALRLALDAQIGGATAIVIPPEHAELRSLLLDRRFTLPVLSSMPPDLRTVRMPANCVVHPHHFRDDRQAFDPIVVTDAKRARNAERKLFEATGKSSDGWLARCLNRRISRRVSRWLSRTALTPNQVSVFTLGFGLCGAWLAAQGGYAFQLAGAGLLQVQSILDGCDGELARVTHRTSLRGEWLDTIADNATNYAFFGCTALGLYRAGSPLAYPLAGLLALAVSIMMSAILYRDLIRLGTGDVLRHPLLGHGSDSRVVRAIRPLFKRDTFLFALFCAALLDVMGPALVALAFGSIVLFGHLLRLELSGAVLGVRRTSG